MAKKKKNNDFSHDTILAYYGTSERNPKSGKYLMGPSTAKEPKGNWRAGKVGDVFGNTRVVDFRSLNQENARRQHNITYTSKPAQSRFLASEKNKSGRKTAKNTKRRER